MSDNVSKVATALWQQLHDPTKPRADTINSLAAYLLETRSQRKLPQLIAQLQRLQVQDLVSEVTVTSAYPLSSALKKSIEDYVRHVKPQTKLVVSRFVQDKSLIGGVIIEGIDFRLDTTVKRRLQQFASNKTRLGRK